MALPVLGSPCLALLSTIALALFTITAASDARAITRCQEVSGTSAVLPTNAVRTAKEIHKCLGLTLEADVKSRLEALKTKLPASVLNAVFLKDVCVKNKKYPEYLYVPVDGFKYDDVSRRLFTWIGKDWVHTKGDFRFVPHGKYFFIVSTNHNEYLFAANAEHVKDHRRRVFTKVPEVEETQVFDDRRALWEIEPVVNSAVGRVYIKNAQFGEYLYTVNGLNYDKDRRMVATWSKKDNGCAGHEQCIWEIKTC